MRPIPQSASRDGSLQLLELAGRPPADTEIAIAAIPVGTGNNQDAKAFLRYALDQELLRGVEELRPLSKIELSGHQFYFFETRHGVEQHMLLATTLDGYIVRIVLAAHDEKILKQMESSFQHVVFFAPAELRRHLDATAILTMDLRYRRTGWPRYKPIRRSVTSIPERLAATTMRMEHWASVIESLRDGPWKPKAPSNRRLSVIARGRILAGRALGATERHLLEACSRTLFSAWAKRPGADGQIPYDDFGEVTVTAISVACFPGMKFPQDVNDRQGFRDFLLQYGLTHPIVDRHA